MKNLERKLFLLAIFLLGTWGALFYEVQLGVIGISLVYNIVKFRTCFLENLRKYRFCLWVIVGVVLYAALHSIIIIGGGKYSEYSPTFIVFEKLLMCFFLLFLYVISCLPFLDSRLLKKMFWCFCISVLSFNIVMLFHVVKEKLFVDPVQAVTLLYDSRFGFTKHFLGGEVYLDAQAMHIYIAALFAYFLVFFSKRFYMKGLAFLSFLMLVWFLSLTVTKSSILSFICGFILFNLFYLRRLSVDKRWKLFGILLFFGVAIYFIRPETFDKRWLQVKNEIADVCRDDFSGGSTITPRLVFYKSCFKHIDSWGMWGLGVYMEKVSKQWYIESGNKVVASLTHCHNSYLQYWIWLGVVGLFFILLWFLLPVIEMVRQKRFSFLVLSVLLAIFIDCNFETQLVVNDALPVVIFFLYLFYVFRENFLLMEQEDVRFEYSFRKRRQ